MNLVNNTYAILVVDDLPENLDLIVSGLRAMGIQQKIYTAPNGKIGLTLANKYLPDLIITDWEMPVMDGLEMTSSLKAEVKTQNIPVIIMTAVRLASRELAKAFNVGVQDFIRKPFDQLEFRARIQNTLDLAAIEKELRSANDKLEQLNTAKSRFFGNISHDLKTPIALILGQAQLLLDEHEEYLPEATLTKLRKIRKFGMKLNQLSEEIRELILLEEGHLSLKMEIMPIDQIVRDVVDLFAPYVKEEMNISLTLKIESPGIFVEVDFKQFEKVLYNLLANAVEYSPRGGEIEVLVEQTDEIVTISIIDQGPGIPKEILPQIFDRFYQAPDDSNTREGLGIGLSIANEIVALHHGTIDVKSLKSGTKFMVNLHKTAKRPDDKTDSYSVAKHLKLRINDSFLDNPGIDPPSETKKGNILVIDDNPDVRNIIMEILSSTYRIIEAKNGEDALKKLGLYHIDLIITDLTMPVLDGFGFLDKMKEMSNFSKIPCLIISSRFGPDMQKKALKYDVTNFMSKDFDHDELRLRVQALLNQHDPASLHQVFKKYDLENVTKELIGKLEKLVNDNLDNSRFGVPDLAREIATSERKLYKIFNDTLNVTPLEFIKKIRFTHIKTLIDAGRIISISEAARAIGMSNVSVFKSQFEKQFGYVPKIVR